MTRDIRLIGLDLDGTALNTQKEVTPRTRAAIEAAIGAGVVVLPATGRTLSGVPKTVTDIPGVCYAVVSNGAVVANLATGQVLHSDCFSPAAALELLGACRRFDVLISVYVSGQAYAEPFNPEEYAGALPPPMLQYYITSRSYVDDLDAMLRKASAPVEKLNINFKTNAERERAKAYFAALGGCTIASSTPGNLEFNTPTANKGAALLALGRHLGIEKGQMMAIGDSSNDYEMLRAVGYAVAMGNAREDLKAIADDVTAGADEDGVALAIEQVLTRRKQ